MVLNVGEIAIRIAAAPGTHPVPTTAACVNPSVEIRPPPYNNPPTRLYPVMEKSWTGGWIREQAVVQLAVA
jgi:hypothetical protein